MHCECICRSKNHTALAVPGSLGGTDNHNFRRHLSKSEHVDHPSPNIEGQDDVEVSDDVAEQSRYRASLLQQAKTANSDPWRPIFGNCLMQGMVERTYQEVDYSADFAGTCHSLQWSL